MLGAVSYSISGSSYTPGRQRLPAENGRIVLGLIFLARSSRIFRAPLSSSQAARCISNNLVGTATPHPCQASQDLSGSKEMHTT